MLAICEISKNITLLNTRLSETLKARPKCSKKLVRKAKANAGQKVRSYKSESDLVLAEVSQESDLGLTKLIIFKYPPIAIERCLIYS